MPVDTIEMLHCEQFHDVEEDEQMYLDDIIWFVEAMSFLYEAHIARRHRVCPSGTHTHDRGADIFVDVGDLGKIGHRVAVSGQIDVPVQIFKVWNTEGEVELMFQ